MVVGTVVVMTIGTAVLRTHNAPFFYLNQMNNQARGLGFKWIVMKQLLIRRD